MRQAILFLLLTAALPFFRVEAQVAIIVNAGTAVASLSKTQLLDIYALNLPRWEDGARVVIFELKGSGKVKESFYKFLGMEPDDMKKIWLRKQFSGKAMPPRAFDDEDEMIARIAKTPGAIGYASLSAARGSSGVKVVATIK